MDFVAIGRHVLGLEIEGLTGVRETLDARFSQAVACLAECEGRIITTGIGKSGLIGRKMIATFLSIGCPAAFLHPVEAMHGDLGLVQSVDVALVLSNSGETSEVLNIVPELIQRGCKTIGITRNDDSSLAQLVDFVLPVRVEREACILDLIPTASTTAVMAVGDALAACLAAARQVTINDFYHCHPGGELGRRLSEKVNQIMITNGLPVVEEGSPASEALSVLDCGGFGLVVVTGNKRRIEGIVTDGDIRRALVRGQLGPDTGVTDIMTRIPRTIRDTCNVEEAIDIMEANAITALPVVDGNNILVGILHIHDVLGKGKIKFTRGLGTTRGQTKR
jgi:arabinose-5-phosphate isomerase